MNKRQRKKQLKNAGAWVQDFELWNFDVTICDWIIPRLKRFKQINMGYPGIPPYDTQEKWDAAIDQMIRSFELLRYAPIDLDENLEPRDDVYFNMERHQAVYEKWKAETDKGLKIFAEHFSDLWI